MNENVFIMISCNVSLILTLETKTFGNYFKVSR